MATTQASPPRSSSHVQPAVTVRGPSGVTTMMKSATSFLQGQVRRQCHVPTGVHIVLMGCTVAHERVHKDTHARTHAHTRKSTCAVYVHLVGVPSMPICRPVSYSSASLQRLQV